MIIDPNPTLNTPRKLRFFERLYTGRIGRKNFFLGFLLGFPAMFLETFLWGFIRTLEKSVDSEIISLISSISSYLFPLLITASLIWFFLMLITIIPRRFHDLGAPGELAFLLFAPLINLVTVLVLFFKKGVPGPNEYGLEPTYKPVFKDIFNRS